MSNGWIRVTRVDPCRACGGIDRCAVKPNHIDPDVISCVKKDTYNGKKTHTVKQSGAGTCFIHTLRRTNDWKMNPRKSTTTQQTRQVISLVSPDAPTEEQIPQHEIDENRHAIYSRLIERMPLSPIDRTDNEKRKIDPKKLGYASCPNRATQKKAIKHLVDEFGIEQVLSVPGFVMKSEGQVTLNCGEGLLVPVRNLHGQIVALRWRNPNPSPTKAKWIWLSSKKDGGESPGTPLHWAHNLDSDVCIVVEGERKSDCVAALPFASESRVVSVPGVSSWESCGLIKQLEDIGCTTVRIAYDSDQWDNPHVANATLQLAHALEGAHFHIEFLTWDPGCKGLDDALHAGLEITVLAGSEAANHRAKLAKEFGLELNGQKPRDPRPVLNVGDPQNELLEQSLFLLREDEYFFMKNGVMVIPFALSRKLVRGNPNSDPILVDKETGLKIADSQMVSARLAQLARFVKYVKNRETGDLVEVGAPVPPWLANQIVSVAGKLGYHGPREIAGLISGPTVDEDGNLLNQTGYCKILGEGWYQAGPIAGLEIPETPTLEQCQQAKEKIWEAVQYFEWSNKELDFSKWLTGLLSAFLRHQISCTPFFLVVANSPGTGKSYLSQSICLICHGHDADGPTWPTDPRNRDDELGKSFANLVAGGTTLALFDNLPCGEDIESPTMCRFVTEAVFKTRQLGKNDGTFSGGANRVLLFGNGNNVSPAGDLADRTLIIQLETEAENPRARSADRFAAIGDLKTYCRNLDHRRELAAAALTIARGYIRNGRLHGIEGAETWGGFPEFVDLPIGAVRWIMGIDPLSDRKQVFSSDSRGGHLLGFLDCWRGLFPGTQWVQAKAVCEMLAANPLNETAVEMATAIDSLDADPSSPKSMGKLLNKIKGKRKEIDGKLYSIRSRKGRTKTDEYQLEVFEKTKTTQSIPPKAPNCRPCHNGMQGYVGFEGFPDKPYGEQSMNLFPPGAFYMDQVLEKSPANPQKACTAEDWWQMFGNAMFRSWSRFPDFPPQPPVENPKNAWDPFASPEERVAALKSLIPASGIPRHEVEALWTRLGWGTIDRELELAATEARLVGNVMWVWQKRESKANCEAIPNKNLSETSQQTR